METDERLNRVLAELARYQHPLFDFSARLHGDAVEISITCRLPMHTYVYEIHPRDIDHPQFPWTFQRQLYDCLHDYVIEMFTKNPQYREL